MNAIHFNQRQILCLPLIALLMAMLLTMVLPPPSAHAAKAVDDTFTVNENSAAVTISVLANDEDTPSVVFANSNTSARVCPSDEAGNFANCKNLSSDSSSSLALVLANVNGDSDNRLDAILGNSLSNRWCSGNGSGGFSSSYCYLKNGN
ncbi:MAG: hypothetical protein DRR08_24485 [Candidatus Parabeggiatoa sp. nov. 2]|nr:MAG: hypothetical protein B6247_04955 [Beggiatoa sp. 4572_84]RKZ55378.1 MAG: hypothetical protein DRR08_24485 [Gammaproteobacteria bacterium]